MQIKAKIQQWSWQLQASLDPGEALTGLFQRYSEPLYRYAATLGGRREVAEDAVQEVFLRLTGDLSKLAAITNPQAYLYRSVRNQILRQEPHWSELPDGETVASDTLSMSDRVELLEALRALPLEQRETLFLKEVLQLSFRELSEILELSLGTVTSRHRYALQKLRDQLSPVKERVYA